MVAIVLSRESAMWREESMKTLLHSAQLKYVDVGETRVVTNSRYMAEQILSDGVENVVMDASTVVEDEVMRWAQELGNLAKSWRTLRWTDEKIWKTF